MTPYTITTGPLFDPAAVSRQIDSMLSAIPSGQRGAVVLSADLPTRRGSAALMIKAGDHVAFVARVSKAQGGDLQADASARISFLAGTGGASPITRDDVVGLLMARGNTWLQAQIKASVLVSGLGDVYLEADKWLA